MGRLLQAVFVLFAAYTTTFILLQALPGDAFLIKFANPEMGLSAAQLDKLREVYGVNASLPEQFFASLLRLASGDLGVSLQYGVPVADLLATGLWSTVRLAVLALCGAIVLAFAIALSATLAPFRWLAAILRSVPPLFASLPAFWLAIMLIQIFSFRLKLISVINPGEVEGLVLPVLTLSIVLSAPLAQVLLRNIDAVSVQPFVSVARAKGAARSWVIWRHVVGNALLPTVTMAGLLLAELLGGAVITETVFGTTGIGSLTVAAVNFQDLPVLQAVVLIAAAVFVTVNLLVDLLYPLIDPRLGKRRSA